MSIEFMLNNDIKQVETSETIRSYLERHDIELPSLCYHPSLGAIETCDACIVKVNDEFVRACSTELKQGDVIETKDNEVHEAQLIAMDRVLGNHELYCTVCDFNNGNCEIHNTVKEMKIEHQETPHTSKGSEVQRNAFYRYDPDQCILCGRCVEACQDLQVNETLLIDWTLERPRVIWDNDTTIDESSCVNCGHCSTVCPCNAMMEVDMEGEAGFLTGMAEKNFRPLVEATKEVETGYGSLMTVSDIESQMREQRIEKTKTVCTYCGVGCSFDVWTKDREILKVEPSVDAPANGVSTCVKGKFGWDFVNSEERLEKPLIREGDSFREAEWEEALNLIEDKFKEKIAQKGADALAFISSSKCTNEESYLMQKLARGVVGTNNIDNCSRYCQSPATMGLWRTVGYGGDSGGINEDIAEAELVISIGSNTAESHPVLATRVKRAQKLHGQKVIVADLRKHELAERADLFVQPVPGSDLVWLSAVTKYILDQGWQDDDFLEQHVNNADEYIKSLEKYTLDYAEAVTGMSQETLIDIAKAVHEAESTSILWAMGVTQHGGGSDTSTAISNLLLITGNYMKQGAGAYPLRGHNNVQGASDFGSMPDRFPGYQFVTDDEVRHRFEENWGKEIPSEPGLNNHEMVDAIHEGNLDIVYIKGEDMGIVDSNINYVRDAFEKLDFFVVQDIFFSKTCEYADVVLPASPSLEKDGTFVNTERRFQRIYQALEPLGKSKPDWQIIKEIANRLGANWDYKHPSEIMDEAASLTPLFAGVSYDRLEGYDSLQWPVEADGTDTPRLFEKDFPLPEGKAKLWPVEWTKPLDFGDEYDLHVNNGRLLEHFHEGNMTYKSEAITGKTPSVFLEVSPELAEERGVEDGTMVRLLSPYGKVKVSCIVTERVTGNQLYLPMNSNGEGAINYLTSSHADKDTDTPAYKEVSVKMEVLEPIGKSPLTTKNHRYGNPQPQIGVNVKEKWARSDYKFPGDIVKEKRVNK
ncbi:MAG TPA: formate dehydrogenase subunit alpha [Staphylococcus sp.]|nr:formate dehydrogenase subunit alpha [Staphylococcus sp.]